MSDKIQSSPHNTGVDANPPLVFVCYSKQDKDMLDEFLTICSPYIDAGDFVIWSDRYIEAGEEWEPEIFAAMEDSFAFVILVSPYSLATRFVVDKELPKILEARKERDALLLWLLLESCAYDKTALGSINAISDIKQPLSKMSREDRNAIWVKVANKLAQKVAQKAPLPPFPHITPSIPHPKNEEPLSPNTPKKYIPPKFFEILHIMQGANIQIYPIDDPSAVAVLQWNLPELSQQELYNEATHRAYDWKILHEETEKLLHPLMQLKQILESIANTRSKKTEISHKTNLINLLDQLSQESKKFHKMLFDRGTDFTKTKTIQQLTYTTIIIEIIHRNSLIKGKDLWNEIIMCDFTFRQVRTGLQVADSVLKSYFETIHNQKSGAIK